MQLKCCPVKYREPDNVNCQLDYLASDTICNSNNIHYVIDDTLELVLWDSQCD